MTPTQVAPVGQPLRPGPQPGTQKPLGPLQTMPEVGPPHAESPPAPAQPHKPVAVRQVGCAPPQSAAFVAEHSVHAPASAPVV